MVKNSGMWREHRDHEIHGIKWTTINGHMGALSIPRTNAFFLCSWPFCSPHFIKSVKQFLRYLNNEQTNKQDWKHDLAGGGNKKANSTAATMVSIISSGLFLLRSTLGQPPALPPLADLWLWPRTVTTGLPPVLPSPRKHWQQPITSN